jgi:hypothetical protein
MNDENRAIVRSLGHLDLIRISDFVIRISNQMSLDFFDFFRYALGTVASVYATVITLQSLWTWYIWLAGGDKYIGMLRRYLIVHGLRLRFSTFWGDVMISLLLCVAFGVLCVGHARIAQLASAMQAARQPNPIIHVSRLAP